jgi:hypothetical protein
MTGLWPRFDSATRGVVAKTTTVVRCPACGSTHAGEVGGAYDLTHMACSDCGHSEYADHWQIKFDWNVEISLPDDATELPRFVAPLDERDSVYVKPEEDTTKPALPAPPKPHPEG